jgi:glycosyltransferase involved in cell wall biosynthesis
MIALDVSRLLSCAARPTPTGIDRVELAYARHFAAAGEICFVRPTALGRLAALPKAAVERYIEALSSSWRDRSGSTCRARLRWTALRLQLARAPSGPAFLRRNRNRRYKHIYLLVSHHHLEKRRFVAAIKRRHAMSFVCLVHDVIPVEFPEYAKPGQDRRHKRRIETATALSDAVIVPSSATAAALRRHFRDGVRQPRMLVAPFGIEATAVGETASDPPRRPYFVCLGTIEARKNHLLLLNLWREIALQTGEQAPVLVLIGRRGWEAESAIDMLERCPALRGTVIERGGLTDAEAAALLRRARALLLPSYAEGYGFPVVEALACGTPVLCSDIAALREIGGDIPEYLDPLDGPAWRTAVLEYAADPSPRREAQRKRLAVWRLPQWSDHFAAVEALLADFGHPPG